VTPPDSCRRFGIADILGNSDVANRYACKLVCRGRIGNGEILTCLTIDSE